MAKNTTGRSPGRRQKTSRTIDLEVNKVSGSGSEVTDSAKASSAADGSGGKEKAENAAMKSTAGKPGAAASKGSSAKNSDDGKVIVENAGEAPIKPKASSTPNTGSKTPKPEASSTKPRTSFGAMLLSAVLGGGVALGGAGALNNAGVLNSVPVIGGLFGSQDNGEADAAIQAANDQIAALNGRLEQLEGAALEADPDASADLSAVTDRLSDLENRLSEVSGGGETARQALATAEAANRKADETAAQVEQLNTSIVDAAAGTDGGGVDIEAVKSALLADTNALSARIDAVEGALNAQTSVQGGNASNEAMEALRAELDGLKAGIGALQSGPDSLGTLQTNVDGLGEQVAEAGNSLESVSARVDALETTVNETIVPAMGEVEKAATAAIESQRVARSVSARALGTVLEQGGRFASELAAAEALIGQSEAVSGLQELSQAGILTEAELLAQFETVSNGILESESSNAAGEGVLDRFMASAKSLVQVRPSGPVEGDSTAAVISRIEAALNSGQLSQAKTEWQQFGDAARAASEKWAMALDDRIRAESLIQTVIGELNAETGQEG